MLAPEAKSVPTSRGWGWSRLTISLSAERSTAISGILCHKNVISGILCHQNKTGLVKTGPVFDLGTSIKGFTGLVNQK